MQKLPVFTDRVSIPSGRQLRSKQEEVLKRLRVELILKFRKTDIIYNETT